MLALKMKNAKMLRTMKIFFICTFKT